MLEWRSKVDGRAHNIRLTLKVQLSFLATACEANRGLCDRFAVIDACYIYIYLFTGSS